MTGEGNWNAKGVKLNCEMCWLPINGPRINPGRGRHEYKKDPRGYIKWVSLRVKFGRVWNSSPLFGREWNAKSCRYRFILMEENTRRDTPVVSLMDSNDSIRVLFPLYHLVSVQSLHDNPHRKHKYSLQTSRIYKMFPLFGNLKVIFVIIIS